MNEEVFIRQEADELTNKIADRLGERQKKLERMAEWEKQAKKPVRLRPIYVTIAVAACIGVLFFFSPFSRTNESVLDDLNIGTPSLTEYRAANKDMSEIANLMENEDYEKALEKTEIALNRSNESLKMLAEVAAEWDDDEAVKYDQELEWAVNSELRWTYIYLLIKQGHKKEAKKEIKHYLQYPEYCEHEAEARALLEKIKNKE